MRGSFLISFMVIDFPYENVQISPLCKFNVYVFVISLDVVQLTRVKFATILRFVFVKFKNKLLHLLSPEILRCIFLRVTLASIYLLICGFN